jgi:hypothetical protein
VEESQDYFSNETGRNIPRLCVSHDMLSFPIGFKESIGNKVRDVYEQARHNKKVSRYVSPTYFFVALPLRFNISSNDIYRAISDNTLLAVSASRLIIDHRATVSQKVFCMMHTVDLAVKHALGISVRRKNKVVLDECLHLKRICSRVKEFCSYVMDKHNKSRFKELKKISTGNWKCDCCKFEIPNVTRVAESLIRNKHLIDLALTYQFEQLQKLQEFDLTDAKGIVVVQIECILEKMTALL